jgi:hypothetical protein
MKLVDQSPETGGRLEIQAKFSHSIERSVCSMNLPLSKMISILLVLISVVSTIAQEPADSHSKSHLHKHAEPTLVFFKINGEAAKPYLEIRNTSKDFLLPFFVSPQIVLVNEAIDIEIDPGILETASIKAHNSTIPDAKFIWDFGDGKLGSGTRNKHAYSKPGSYILSIYIQSKLFDEPKIFKTLLFHILPQKNYRLPQAVIEINGQLVRENSREVIKTSFQKPVKLVATKSIAGTTELVEYVWDLSDRSLSKQPALSHTYNRASYNARPILRVRDKNGFISDAYVEILNLDATSER